MPLGQQLPPPAAARFLAPLSSPRTPGSASGRAEHGTTAGEGNGKTNSSLNTPDAKHGPRAPRQVFKNNINIRSNNNNNSPSLTLVLGGNIHEVYSVYGWRYGEGRHGMVWVV